MPCPFDNKKLSQGVGINPCVRGQRLIFEVNAHFYR